MDYRLNWLCLALVCGMPASGWCAEATPVNPNHVVTLAQVHKGSLAVDTVLLDSFGRLPKEKRTFYLAAREILAGSPTATPAHPEIIAAAEKAGLPLISGPMLGDSSESGITVWFRPVHAEVLTVHVTATKGDEEKAFRVDVTRPGTVARVRLIGLQANTEYTYQLVNNAGDVLGKGAFRTAPRPDTQETIRTFSDGSAIQVTSTRLFGPDETSLQQGVKPHLKTDRLKPVDLAITIVRTAADSSLEALIEAGRKAVNP